LAVVLGELPLTANVDGNPITAWSNRDQGIGFRSVFHEKSTSECASHLLLLNYQQLFSKEETNVLLVIFEKNCL